MTGADLRCLDFVREFAGREGHGPTYQQIADGLQLSGRSRAYRLVSRLVEEGLLQASGDKGGILPVGHVNLAAVPTERLLEELRRREALPR